MLECINAFYVISSVAAFFKRQTNVSLFPDYKPMKLSSRLAAILFFSATTITGFAQGRSLGGGNGFDSGDINAKPDEAVKETTKVVKTIQFVAVSPERLWQSADKTQSPIKGTLLAFAREKNTGKVSIVENGEVRLLIGKKDFTLPLNKLSPDDQAYVSQLVDSARSAGKLIEPPAPQKAAERSGK